jgi:hypothetical protein
MMVAVAVLLAACGGGGDDETGQEPVSSEDDASGGDGDVDEYAAPLAEGLQNDPEAPDLDDTQATCMARGIVDAIGVDTLKDADISPEEFVAADDLSTLDFEMPADAVDSLGRSIAACDIADVMENGLVLSSFSDEFGFDLPPDGATCLAEQIDDQALADAVAEVFLVGTGEPLQTVIIDAIVGCPSVAAGAFISQAPAPLSPEGEQCVTDFVSANPELVRSLFASGGDDDAVAEQFGTQLAAACPEVAGM